MKTISPNTLNKFYVSITIIVISLLGCSQSMKEVVEPIFFDTQDINDLDSINRLILENVDLLMDSTANHFEAKILPAKDDANRKSHWYFTKPWMLEKYLSIEMSSLPYLTRHSTYERDKLRHFRINDIDFFPADSMFAYELKQIAVGDTVITHKLWCNIQLATLDIIKPNAKLVEDVNESWKYIISFHIDYGPL